jgi:hypothetical protein
MKRIHVNQHIIRRNKTNTERLPVFTVKEGNSNRYALHVGILGPSSVVYRPDQPLSCGAHVWIETEADLVLEGEMTWDQVREQR